jgi:hypothetical protein
MLSETRGWPLVARGAYYELLAAQWDAGVLPRDPRRLRTFIGATATEWRVAWPLVESKFPLITGGRQNALHEERRQEAYRLREQHRRGANTTNAGRSARRSATRSALGERIASTTTATGTDESPQRETGPRDATTVVDPRERGR